MTTKKLVGKYFEMRKGDRIMIKIEEEYWEALNELALLRDIELIQLINEIRDRDPSQSLTSELKYVAFRYIQEKLNLLMIKISPPERDDFLKGNIQPRALLKFFELSPVPCLIVDSNGYICMSNPACKDMLGLDQKETKRRALNSIMLIKTPKGSNLKAILKNLSLGKEPVTLHAVHVVNVLYQTIVRQSRITIIPFEVEGVGGKILRGSIVMVILSP